MQVDPQFLEHYPEDPGGVCTDTPESVPAVATARKAATGAASSRTLWAAAARRCATATAGS